MLFKSKFYLLFLLFLPTVSYAEEIVAYLASYRFLSSDQFFTAKALDPEKDYLTASVAPDLNPRNVKYLLRRYQTPTSLKEIYPEERWAKSIDVINYFALRPDGNDGSLQNLEESERNFSILQWMKSISDTKVFLSVAGQDKDFLPTLTHLEKRRNFIYSLYNVYKENDFDGIDIDWEFPQSEEDLEYLEVLATELREFEQDEPLELSIAINPSLGTDKSVLLLFDKINIMSYDFPARHSSYETVLQIVNDFLLRYDPPPNRINLGLPFYGRIYDLEEPNYWKDAISYRDLAKQVDYDLDLLNTDQIDGYYFNGPSTIIKKVQLAHDLKLNGVMIWEIGQDSLIPEVSLLGFIEEKINKF